MAELAKNNVLEILKDELVGTAPHSLGKLIAIINKMDLVSKLKSKPSILPDDKNLVSLKELLIKIKDFENAPKRRNVILTSVPGIECDQENCFLEEKWDFFVPYLVDILKDNFDGEICNKLMKHLNDCFRCMSCFSDVMRDYHRQYYEVKQE